MDCTNESLSGRDRGLKNQGLSDASEEKSASAMQRVDITVWATETAGASVRGTPPTPRDRPAGA
jgi:hypothetical protein